MVGNAETEAAKLLSNLGVDESLHHSQMADISGNQKVRVLLAQALFGQPDVLLLDEPTNDLDAVTVKWLENFLADYQNTLIVVSHDRHFLDAVCTHICDIDFGKVRLFTGNYTFWYESSQLMLRQMAQKNKKTEAKAKELKEFIARFSANASKSKQATSRKKALEKLNIEEIRPSTRKYPHIAFNPERKAGDQLLEVKDLRYEENGHIIFKDVSFLLEKGDRVALLSKDSKILSSFYEILAGERNASSGSVNWGVTITPSYLPNENSKFFESKLTLIDWLRQYSENKEEPFIRGFLGRMLFSGEETLKTVDVLSGGEKVRCMLSRLMLQNGNFLLLNEPTNHLDLESITALNNAMNAYDGNFIMSTHDHELMQTTCNRIIELGPEGIIDKTFTTYDEYLSQENLAELRSEIYQGLVVEALINSDLKRHPFRGYEHTGFISYRLWIILNFNLTKVDFLGNGA